MLPQFGFLYRQLQPNRFGSAVGSIKSSPIEGLAAPKAEGREPRATAPLDGEGRPQLSSTPALHGEERSPFRLPPDWEGFSQRGKCSHATMRKSIFAMALKSFGRGGVRCFEIFRANGRSREKVAQAVVLTSGGRHWFLDRLAISPELADLWPSVVQCLLFQMGPGRYGYARTYNDEACRAAEFRSLPGVRVEFCPTARHAKHLFQELE